ncbi:hypothetical protein AB0F81_47255 [Actinoplanes sp. NPDC024001]|uniref:hypothetical protein n=1 Tax=Actinoplanes sp. NPDC024001 TaxID=3154598 RepID=UPI0033E9FD99
MTVRLLADLEALQQPDGCFPSRVTAPGSCRLDRNGFVTALVVRALRDVPGAGRIRDRALDLLRRCASERTPGAYRFWPAGEQPAWAPRLPADVDDTAIITRELLRHGRIDRATALRTACHVLLPQRATAGRELSPPWIVPGAFHTWITREKRGNPVDACVNVNVVALLAALDARHLPGYAEAVRTVTGAVAWAGADPARRRAITPFYPDPYALREATEHAVECGATELAPVLPRLPAGSGTPAAPVCCSAYGHTYWWCPALDLRAEMRRAACSTTVPTCPGRSSTASTGRTERAPSC